MKEALWNFCFLVTGLRVMCTCANAMGFPDLPPNYATLSAGEKQDILWSRVVEKPYPDDKLPTANPGVFSSLLLFSPSYTSKSFTTVGDQMMRDREKIIHTYGSVGKVELQISADSRYTGVFQAGSTNIALVRFSLAQQDKTNFIPAMAMKIFVNEQPSLNVIAMFSVNGQGENRNFFANTFSNFLPPVEGFVLKAIGHQFRAAIESLPGGTCDRPSEENKLPLMTQASFNADGSIVSDPKPPLFLKFIPNPAVGWNEDSTRDFRLHLAEIPVGTVLYTVSAVGDDSQEKTIGQVILRSQLVASEYGDAGIFFQHHPKRC